MDARVKGLWWADWRTMPFMSILLLMDDYLTTIEAAALIGITPAYIRVLTRKGRLKGRKVNQAVLVERASLLQYRKEADAYNKAKGLYKATKPTK